MASTVILTHVGCTTPPRHGYFVTDVNVHGNDEISDAEITELLATQATPKFAGLVRGLIYEYESFDEHLLIRDLRVVERLYHSRGYYHARAQAGRIVRDGENSVRVELVVDEGPATHVVRLRFDGLQELPEEERTAVLSAFGSRLSEDDRLQEEELEAAREALLQSLKNLGYAHASTKAHARVDLSRNQAYVAVEAKPGEKMRYGKVSIEGLGPIPEEPVRRALAIEEGEFYSQEELDDAEQALMNLGVFTSVTIDDRAEDGQKTASADDASGVPIVVQTQPAELHTLRLGVGGELDIIRTEFHVTAGWEHQNLFGGLRRFSIDVEPGIVLYPTRVPEFERPDRALPGVKTGLDFEQPGFLEERTRGFVSLDYDIYPVLLTPEVDDEAPVVGYREFRGRVGVKRRFARLTLTPSQNLQTGIPFTYVGSLAESATRVVISYLELHGDLDLRDDAVKPTSGAQFLGSVQFAGVGGDARDLRIEPDARVYIPVVKGKSSFALRTAIGFLFPFNYETPGSASEVSVKDTQLAYFRSFFSGGPSSNRGYPYRGVGPHGAVAFFNPELASASGACDEAAGGNAGPGCGVPLGGRTLWEASVAFRFMITGPFSGAVFCDASDVSEQEVDIVLRRPHLSCGVGPRYDTPVGAIRLDVAYRIDGLQVLGPNDRNEGAPGDILGLPINVSLGIGEAY